MNGSDIQGQAAVALAIADEDDPVFGLVTFRAQASLDESAGTAFVDNVYIVNMSFPDESSRDLADRIISKAISGASARLSINQLNSSMRLAELQDRISDSSSIKTEAPDIYVDTRPTLLVIVEGDPRLVQDPSGNFMRVVNTPFDLLLHPSSNKYFLRAGDDWFESMSVDGNWSPSRSVPREISSLPKQSADLPSDGTTLPTPAKI